MVTNASKVWLVTGSSRGLGRAIVESALVAGHRVVATARKPEQLQELAKRYGDKIRAVALNVTDSEAAIRTVHNTVEAFGRLDVLVNNAGYGDTASVEDVSLDDFKAQIDTNFYGVVYVTKAALPVMRTQGFGNIFQISSVGGRIGAPGLAAYQSAKWAVGGFSTVLAQEVAPLGIKVTVIEPGGMRTDWAGPSMNIPPVSKPYEQTVGAFAQMIRDFSGKEPTDPAKVAQVILKLADMAEPPLRLLIGSDAVKYAAAAAKQLAESDAQWCTLSESVGFDNAMKDVSNQ
jgi:NAD(P)-dependent dehydrogenase (short-subunit alcohol dehydrogenase family)